MKHAEMLKNVKSEKKNEGILFSENESCPTQNCVNAVQLEGVMELHIRKRSEMHKQSTGFPLIRKIGGFQPQSGKKSQSDVLKMLLCYTSLLKIVTLHVLEKKSSLASAILTQQRTCRQTNKELGMRKHSNVLGCPNFRGKYRFINFEDWQAQMWCVANLFEFKFVHGFLWNITLKTKGSWTPYAEASVLSVQ